MHVSMNGLGERAGNAELAETVMALELLYEVDTGVDIEKLGETSRIVEHVSGYPNALTKPVVGRNIFLRESGAVVQQMLVSPQSVEAFEPALVGLDRNVVLGKNSGQASIRYTLQRLGIGVGAVDIESALRLVKDLATKRRRLVTDAEFIGIVNNLRGRSTQSRPEDR